MFAVLETPRQTCQHLKALGSTETNTLSENSFAKNNKIQDNSSVILCASRFSRKFSFPLCRIVHCSLWNISPSSITEITIPTCYIGFLLKCIHWTQLGPNTVYFSTSRYTCKILMFKTRAEGYRQIFNVNIYIHIYFFCKCAVSMCALTTQVVPSTTSTEQQRYLG